MARSNSGTRQFSFAGAPTGCSSSGRSPIVIGPGPTCRLLMRAISWRKSRTLPG